MLDTEVHNDLREMMTTHINNTAADRPLRNAIISSPISPFLLPIVTGGAK